MSFSQPEWLWLLPVALAAIFLLHARRKREVIVPSLNLWRRVDAVLAAAPNRRSLSWREASLWLQLLAASLLVLALAGPVFGAGKSDRWVVLLDTSLSMNATDVEPTRSAAAVREVKERWASPGASGRVSLVAVGVNARLVAADWPAGPGLRQAVDELEADAGKADWVGAAARAANLVAGVAGTRVAVITDAFGTSGALAALAAAGFDTESVDLISVGAELVNVGVGDVDAVARGTRPDQWMVSGRVVTTGFSRGDVVRIVASFRPPGTNTFLPWGSEEVTIHSDGTGEFSIPLDLPGPGEVQVRGPDGDHLSIDDAVVVSLRAEPLRTVIVGAVPPALLRSLQSIAGVVTFAAHEVPAPKDAALFDLAIVTEARTQVPATSTLWLGAVPEGLATGEARDIGKGSLHAGAHTLMSDVDASTFSVKGAVPLELPAGATALLESAGDVFAWARTSDVGRQVVLGFDLDGTDWDSQVSFPAFVARLMDWASPRSWSQVPGGCRVGETCDWPREAFAAGWELSDPSGRVVVGTPSPEALSDDPLANAVWPAHTLDAGFRPTRIGSYTLTSPAVSVPLPVVASPLSAAPGAPSANPAVTLAPRPFATWPLLAALGAAVILFETVFGLARIRRAMRRHWRLPLTLVVAAVVSVALGLLNVPLPSYGPSETIVWIGAEEPPVEQMSGAGRVAWAWIATKPLSVTGDETAQPRGAVDLATALEYALALPGGTDGVRLLVQTEGAAGTPLLEVKRLAGTAAAIGVPIDVLAPAPSTRDDRAVLPVGFGEITLPERVRADSQYVLAAQVTAPQGTEWRVEATLRSERNNGVATEAHAPEPMPKASAFAEASGVGDGSAELKLQAGTAGGLVYDLELILGGGQTAVATTGVSVLIGPAPAVLLVATDADRGVGLQLALETQGLTVDRVTPFRMPGSLERLVAYDAVALVDVAASNMFPEYQRLLERYVREAGGGVLIVGGTSTYGPGGYFATPLEDLSPLSSRITDEAPEVAMAFVLDRSGSMSGAVDGSNRMDLAKAATLAAIDLLGERSLAAVIAFDTEARVVLPLTPVVDRETFGAALSSVTAAGGTSIYPGLVAAHELMSAAASATRHVVVMTDGLSQEGDFSGAMSALAQAGISTSFVGVGDAADRRQLAELANLGGGALHMALDFRALPSLLAQEALMLAANPIEEGTVMPRWADHGPPEFLAGTTADDLPALGGYVRTTLKDEASVHAFAKGDDPLLASWRYGLGRVVAFTSDGDGRWSQPWLRSEEYGPLWAQAVRWVADGPVRDPWSLRLARRGEVLDVVVDLPAEAIPALTVDLPAVTVTSASGGLFVSRQLERTGPSTAATSFELDTTFPGEITVSLLAAPRLGLAQGTSRTVAWPLPAGHSPRSDILPVASLGELTGGDLYRSVNELDFKAAHFEVHLWQLPSVWLCVALAAFLTSLAVRFGALSRVPALLRALSVTRTRRALPGR